jgi:hypothetical protein
MEFKRDSLSSRQPLMRFQELFDRPMVEPSLLNEWTALVLLLST